MGRIKLELDNGPDLVFEGSLLGETPHTKGYERYTRIQFYATDTGRIIVAVQKINGKEITGSVGHTLHNWSELSDLLDEPGSGIRWSAKLKKLLREIAEKDPGAMVVVEKRV